MRAMRRARISSAATREASSSCRHAVASGAAGGFGVRSGGSRNASFNCMTALPWRRRLDVSAAQSVDDLSQVKQIAEPAQIVVAIAAIVRRRSVGLLRAPIGPLGWNERPASVRQNHENQENALPRRMLLIAASDWPSKAWRSRVIVTEPGTSR